MTKEEFLRDIGNWSNHRHLLWPALEATTGQVIEFGCGDGSTPYLHEYCRHHNREFLSFDNNPEWAEKYSHLGTQVVEDWGSLPLFRPDVLFIDHAPGERRHTDIRRFSDYATIIVIHDSEPAATGYMLDKIWPLFKYRIDYKTDGAWASAVSNYIDVTKWKVQ